MTTPPNTHSPERYHLPIWYLIYFIVALAPFAVRFAFMKRPARTLLGPLYLEMPVRALGYRIFSFVAWTLYGMADFSAAVYYKDDAASRRHEEYFRLPPLTPFAGLVKLVEHCNFYLNDSDWIAGLTMMPLLCVCIGLYYVFTSAPGAPIGDSAGDAKEKKE